MKSNVAKGMIVAKTGIKKVFRDRRERRMKDAKRSWKREDHNV